MKAFLKENIWTILLFTLGCMCLFVYSLSALRQPDITPSQEALKIEKISGDIVATEVIFKNNISQIIGNIRSESGELIPIRFSAVGRKGRQKILSMQQHISEQHMQKNQQVTMRGVFVGSKFNAVELEKAQRIQ